MKFRLVILFLWIPAFFLHAQPEITDSIARSKPSLKARSKGLIHFIGHLLNDMDTVYVSPNKYNFAFMLENSNWYEYYRLESHEGPSQSITISPQVNYKLGAYFGWKWIFLGWSIDLKNLFHKDKYADQRTEFGLSLYSSFVGGDIYYRKTGNNFKIRSTSGIFPDEKEPEYDRDFEGLSADIRGLNVYFIFNHKRFSYPAAYSQSTNQRKSAGSLIAGFSFSRHVIDFDHEKLPDPIQENLQNSLMFEKVKYHDYSLSAGYAYNWVFARNCLLSLSLAPAIAYKASEINTEEVKYPLLKKINFDLITRAGIVWNNSKYFIGASLVMHTYDYKSDKFYLNNSFGTLRIYAGFNFMKKKQYRDK